MEFEDVSEKVEWEARRVAAAFRVNQWQERQDETTPQSNQDYRYFYGFLGETRVMWGFWVGPPCLELRFLFIGPFDSSSRNHCSAVRAHDRQWGLSRSRLFPCPPGRLEIMSRGLYRLGIDNEELLAALPPLSAHEKLELRLSLPCEFWPKKWLDEEWQQPR